MTEVLFYGFAALAVAGALGMVLNVRNTVAGAMSLVLTMVSLGAIYVLLEAYLLGVLQILVYAGAIVVLFLFVVMLLNLRGTELGPSRQPILKAVGAGAGILALGFVGVSLHGTFGAAAILPEGFGGYRQVGLALFTDYLLAFESTSLLLLGAMVGAVILAKRSLD
jgi:NADH-quinone oxidoreductase subunit J